MKVIKYQLFIAAALLAGAAIGYFAGYEPKTAAAETPEPAEAKRTSRRAERNDAATIAALRGQVAELKMRLAEREAGDVSLTNAATANAAGALPRGGDRPRMSPREWMENMKKNEPERYAQMTNHLARMRQRREERARTKIDFLSSVDTSRMSAGAKKTHDELQELIARREELEEQMHQMDLTDSQRHELFDEMRETERAMRKLNGDERRNLIEETAKSLGFQGQDVTDIASTIQEVIDATDGDGRGGMMPPPSDGAPPPGGGPGGPGGR